MGFYPNKARLGNLYSEVQARCISGVVAYSWQIGVLPKMQAIGKVKYDIGQAIWKNTVKITCRNPSTFAVLHQWLVYVFL